MAGSESHAQEPEIPPGYAQAYTGDRVIATGVTFVVLEIVVTGLRFWARRLKNSSFMVDDAFILGSLVFQFAFIGCSFADVKAGGVGTHAAVLEVTDPEKLVVWAKFAIALPIMYYPIVVLPKLAVLALYHTVFSDWRYRKACWLIGGLMIANWIGCTIAGLLICRPLAFLWNPTIPGGYCLDINAWYRWSSLVNIITDVIMLVLPIPVAISIQASKRVKAGLLLTLLTGGAGTVTSIVRFVGFFTRDSSADPTWTATRLIILCIVEGGFYHIVACLMCMRPLLRHLWERAPMTTSQRTKWSHGHSSAGIEERQVPLKVLPKGDDDVERLVSPDEHGVVMVDEWRGFGRRPG